MDAFDLQRIPEMFRRALDGVGVTGAVDRVAAAVRDAAGGLRNLADVSARLTALEDDQDLQGREQGELRARLAEMAARLGRIEAQVTGQLRELSELRVRIHGTTARVVRLEDETASHTRELSELRVRVERIDDRVPQQVDLDDLQRHLAENDRRITAALTELREQATDVRRSGHERVGS